MKKKCPELSKHFVCQLSVSASFPAFPNPITNIIGISLGSYNNFLCVGFVQQNNHEGGVNKVNLTTGEHNQIVSNDTVLCGEVTSVAAFMNGIVFLQCWA